MKAFRYFLFFVEVSISVSLLLIMSGYLVKPDTDTPDRQTLLSSLTFTEGNHPSDSSTKQVTIFDLGLQMVRATYTIPSDWLLQQDVYTSPYSYDNYGYRGFDYYQNKQYVKSGNRFTVSLNGSQGEVIRCQEHYGNYLWGKATEFELFKSEVDSLCQVGLLSHVSNLTMGKFFANNPTKARYLSNYVKIDSIFQYLEAPFAGKMEGEDCEGLVRIVYPTPTGSVNLISISVILAPQGALAEVLETENQIAFSYQANPAYEQYQLDIRRGYHLDTRRWHQQYMDQIDDYTPEPSDN